MIDESRDEAVVEAAGFLDLVSACLRRSFFEQLLAAGHSRLLEFVFYCRADALDGGEFGHF